MNHGARTRTGSALRGRPPGFGVAFEPQPVLQHLPHPHRSARAAGSSRSAHGFTASPDRVAEHRLATLRPGALFGEMSLLDGGAAMADVRCEGRCYALHLPRAEFLSVSNEFPSVVEFIRLLSESRRRENDRVLGSEAGAS